MAQRCSRCMVVLCSKEEFEKTHRIVPWYCSQCSKIIEEFYALTCQNSMDDAARNQLQQMESDPNVQPGASNIESPSTSSSESNVSNSDNRDVTVGGQSDDDEYINGLESLDINDPFDMEDINLDSWVKRVKVKLYATEREIYDLIHKKKN